MTYRFCHIIFYLTYLLKKIDISLSQPFTIGSIGDRFTYVSYPRGILIVANKDTQFQLNNESYIPNYLIEGERLYQTSGSKEEKTGLERTSADGK